jgi:hypothetical protein
MTVEQLAAEVCNFCVHLVLQQTGKQQLRNGGVSEASIQRMKSESIDGKALMLLTENDLKDELGIVLGDRRKIQHLTKLK